MVGIIKLDMVPAISHIKWSKAKPHAKDRWINDLQKSLFKFVPYSATIDLDNTAADAFTESDLTVTGVLATDMLVAINRPEPTAGHMLSDAWIDTADTVSIIMENETSSGIDESSQTWYFLIARRKTTVLA